LHKRAHRELDMPPYFIWLLSCC